MSNRRIVFRNAVALLMSQAATMVMSFVTVPLVARALGSRDWGTMYLAGMVANFAVMVVECGQDNYILFSVAKANHRAGEILRSAVALRILIGVALLLPLHVALRLLHYDFTTRLLTMLVYASILLASLSNASMMVVRGLEKMGRPAAVRAFTEVIHTALIFLALWLGARMIGLAFVEIATAAVGVFTWLCILRSVRLGPGRPSAKLMAELLRGGVPFLLWSGVIALQPSLEAVLLTKLASPESLGWFGAANRLVSILLIPAVVLGSALSPTLARLRTTDQAKYRETTREALRIALLAGTPIAVGTFIFASQGTAFVYGARAFGPSADTLRVFSFYVLPVSVNIALGTVLLASGRQLPWALSKAAMLLFTCLASFVVVPYFQRRTGNGGTGAAVMTVVSELGMSAAAVWLLPRGLLNVRPWRDLGAPLAASAVMAWAARLLVGVPFPLALAGAVGAYAVALVAFGAAGRRDLELMVDVLRRKPPAAAPEPPAAGPQPSARPVL